MNILLKKSMKMKFRKGETVICVHDTQELKVGDIKIVEVPVTFCCGGLKFEDDPLHYSHTDFESYNTDDNPLLMVQRKVLIDGFESFSKSVFFNQRNGVIPSDLVRDNMVQFLESIGITKEFFK